VGIGGTGIILGGGGKASRTEHQEDPYEKGPNKPNAGHVVWETTQGQSKNMQRKNSVNATQDTVAPRWGSRDTTRGKAREKGGKKGPSRGQEGPNRVSASSGVGALATKNDLGKTTRARAGAIDGGKGIKKGGGRGLKENPIAGGGMKPTTRQGGDGMLG